MHSINCEQYANEVMQTRRTATWCFGLHWCCQNTRMLITQSEIFCDLHWWSIWNSESHTDEKQARGCRITEGTCNMDRTEYKKKLLGKSWLTAEKSTQRDRGIWNKRKEKFWSLESLLCKRTKGLCVQMQQLWAWFEQCYTHLRHQPTCGQNACMPSVIHVVASVFHSKKRLSKSC